MSIPLIRSVPAGRTAAALVFVAIATLAAAGCGGEAESPVKDLGSQAAQNAAAATTPAYEAWAARGDAGDDRVVRAPRDGDESPYVVTTTARPGELDGEPLDNLQAVLQRLWLDMNEVEAVDAGDPSRVVVWGDVDAEHGQRRFAARYDSTGDGPPTVTAFVATAQEFDSLGGPRLLGGDPARAAAQTPPETVAKADDNAKRELPPAPPAPPPTDVPPPLNVKDEAGDSTIAGWTRREADGAWLADPADPASPRRFQQTFAAGEADGPDQAAKAVAEANGIRVEEFPPVVSTAAHGLLGINAIHFGVGRGTLDGRPRAFAVSVELVKDGRVVVRMADAPPAVMAAWNPATTAAMTSGLIEDPKMLSGELHARVAAASLESQSRVAARMVDLRYQALYQETLATMMNQHRSTLNTMRQMNANLATQTQAILSDGLTVEYDGQGNATLVPEP